MTSSPLGPIRPSIQRFALGTAEVTTILDGVHTPPSINPPYAMDKSEDEIAKIAAPNHVPGDRFEQHYTCTVVMSEGQLVLFDTGFGPEGRDGGTGHLRERLAQAGYAPEDIDVVAFTHAHPDHIMGVMEGVSPAYPNARYVMGRREYETWLSGDGTPEHRDSTREHFLNLIPPLADKVTFVEDGDTIAPGITARAAFGHSPGHMMFEVESGGRQLLIWGDICNHFVFSVQHPDSPVSFDDDPAMATQTRHRILSEAADTGVLIAGYHMPFPSLGYIERQGGTYRWVPASYEIWV